MTVNYKKLNYEVPRMHVIVLDTKDIITTSGFSGEEIPLGPRGTGISDEIF